MSKINKTFETYIFVEEGIMKEEGEIYEEEEEIIIKEDILDTIKHVLN